MKCLSIFCLLLMFASCKLCSNLDIVCQWNQMDFNFPTLEDREEAIRSKDFIQRNVIPDDVDIQYQGIKI